jgi:phosphoribosylformylglycinamidine synthase
MAQAHVYVTPKRTVLDPQGVAVENALKTMGYGEVRSVRVGKFIVLELEEADLLSSGGPRAGPTAAERLRRRVDDMCRKLLSNPVIEDYRVDILPPGRAE